MYSPVPGSTMKTVVERNVARPGIASVRSLIMFGLTDTELQVPAILHKENVARGEASARITSLFRSPIHSLPTGS